MTDFAFTLTIDGNAVPVDQFSATSGVYGSVGHLSTRTSISALAALGIDLVAITSGATAPITVNLSVTQDQDASNTHGPLASAQISNAAPASGAPSVVTTQMLFGGELVDVEYDYDRDSAIIHSRDWAGQLVDQKRVLTRIATSITKLLQPLAPGQNPNSLGVNTVNQTLAQIVTAIANEFSMTPVLNLTGGVPGSTTLGSLYGGATQTFMSVPQSLWEILNQLARDTGYDVYVTPNRSLVFGQAGAGLSTLKLSWNLSQLPQGAVPSKDLKVHHHPRRNATFRVIVFSYDPSAGQQTTGYATVVGANLAGSAGMEPGIWTGNDAITANKQLAGVKKGGVPVSQVPLYSFRIDGLTQAQAVQKALGIATDIAKREFILSCEIDGYPAITPTQPITLAGPVNPAFSGNTFFVNGYEHTFTMPSQLGGGGFITRIKALDIPTLGTGKTGNNDGPLI